MRMLTRRGVLVEDMGQTWLAEPDSDSDEARTLRPLQATAATYRIAFGPRVGQKVLTLRGATPREDRTRQPLCADIDGFSLHAAVRVEEHDRKRLAHGFLRLRCGECGHGIRYHGVLAPNARLRPLVVPQEPEVQERAAEVAVASECDVQEAEPSAHCWAGGSGTRQERAWRRRPAADQPTSTWASNR